MLNYAQSFSRQTLHLDYKIVISSFLFRAEELKGIQAPKPGHETSVNRLAHNISKIGINSTESSSNRPKLTPLELETLKYVNLFFADVLSNF